MSISQVHIDLSQLKALTGGDNAFVIEVLELIERQSPSALAQMLNSYQTGDYQALRAAAHKYKSSINFLGNQELVHLMKQIETTAEDAGPTTELEQLLDEFQGVCDQLLSRINQELSYLKAQGSA